MTSKFVLAARLWYYFRLGYSTYLTFLLGYISTLVTVYYLAIKNIPQLLEVFPRFVPFAALATAVGAPLSGAIGWIHLKRSTMMASEQDISVEANPYTYKLPPSGVQKDVQYPTVLMQLRMIRRIAESEGKLTDSEKASLDDLEQKLEILIRGGYVGSPRRSKL